MQRQMCGPTPAGVADCRAYSGANMAHVHQLLQVLTGLRHLDLSELGERLMSTALVGIGTCTQLTWLNLEVTHHQKALQNASTCPWDCTVDSCKLSCLLRCLLLSLGIISDDC